MKTLNSNFQRARSWWENGTSPHTALPDSISCAVCLAFRQALSLQVVGDADGSQQHVLLITVPQLEELPWFSYSLLWLQPGWWHLLPLLGLLWKILCSTMSLKTFYLTPGDVSPAQSLPFLDSMLPHLCWPWESTHNKPSSCDPSSQSLWSRERDLRHLPITCSHHHIKSHPVQGKARSLLLCIDAFRMNEKTRALPSTCGVIL